MAATYKDDYNKKKARLVQLKRDFEILLKWLNHNTSQSPLWDSKIDEYKKLNNEISLLEARIADYKRTQNGGYVRKYQPDKFNH